MARKPNDDSQIKAYMSQGDQAAADDRFTDAWTAYTNAYTEACKLYGFLHSDLLPILEKLVDSLYRASDNEYYLKTQVKYLRSILFIKQQQHGLDSPELVPALTKLAIFYDLDGAHMLAIEVKQRIDDITERQLATS